MNYLQDAMHATGAHECHLSPRRGLAHCADGDVERFSYFTAWDDCDLIVDRDGITIATPSTHHAGAWPNLSERLATSEPLDLDKWVKAFDHARYHLWRFATLEGSSMRHMRDSVSFRGPSVLDRKPVDVDVPTLARYKITQSSRMSLPKHPGQKLAIFDDAGVSFFPIMGM